MLILPCSLTQTLKVCDIVRTLERANTAFSIREVPYTAEVVAPFQRLQMYSNRELLKTATLWLGRASKWLVDRPDTGDMYYQRCVFTLHAFNRYLYDVPDQEARSSFSPDVPDYPMYPWKMEHGKLVLVGMFWWHPAVAVNPVVEMERWSLKFRRRKYTRDYEQR